MAKGNIDIEKEAISLVKREKTQWQDATAFVTDKVAFQMREFIRQLRRNYWGIFESPIDKNTGRRKTWVPLSETMVEQVVKNIDLDTKDINFRSKHPKGQPYTEAARFIVKDYLDKQFFGEMLDKTERQLAIDGTVVWKTWEGKDKDGKKELKTSIVDLLNFYIDPTADTIQDTGAVIERAVLNWDDFMGMDGWMNKESVKPRRDINKNDADISLNVNYNQGETALVEIFERWGVMPKSLITGKKEDAEEVVEGHIVISNVDTSPVVHKIEVNDSGLKPYEEAWYTRVNGRWYGRGICEKVWMLQLYINTIVNIRINRSYVSQLGLFKIRKGSGITPQVLGRLPSNGAILVRNMDDLEQMVMQEASPASYQDEQTAVDWARQVTSAFESVTGETLPASTTATTAVIQSRSGMSEFQLIKEGIGMFIQRWMDRHAMPVIMRSVKRGDLVRVSSDVDNYRTLVQRVVAYQANKILDETDPNNLPSPVEMQRAMDAAERKLRAKPDLFAKYMGEIAADQLDTQVYVTNEELDIGVTIDKLNYMMSVAPQFAESLVNQAMDLLGLDRPEAGQALPQDAQGQPQGQPQGADQQQLQTLANTLQGSPQI